MSLRRNNTRLFSEKKIVIPSLNMHEEKYVNLNKLHEKIDGCLTKWISDYQVNTRMHFIVVGFNKTNEK